MDQPAFELSYIVTVVYPPSDDKVFVAGIFHDTEAVAFVHFICTFPEINVEDDVPGPYRLM